MVAVSAVALAGLVAFQGGASGASLPAAGRPQVLRLSLTGVVDPFMASYIQRGIHAAASGHDSAVAITIDTPGGLDSSMREIVRSILSSPVPVICYVPPGGRASAWRLLMATSAVTNGSSGVGCLAKPGTSI